MADLLQTGSVLAQADLLRVAQSARVARAAKSQLGQFLTPAPIARLMASMLALRGPEIRLLDPGAGVGSLLAAVVDRLAARPRPPRRIEITAIEVDAALMPGLRATIEHCRQLCSAAGIQLRAQILEEDFLEYAALQHHGDLFGRVDRVAFNCVILNPPYRKIQTSSRERSLLRELGLETSNLYTGFVAASAELLAPRGEIVSITPRSFCNGPYFEPFRRFYLGGLTLRQIHIFDSRQHAFRDDAVLQENVIFAAEKPARLSRRVTITSSDHPPGDVMTRHSVPVSSVYDSKDPALTIHVPTDRGATEIAAIAASFRCRLRELGLQVSTGRVVDFRARQFLSEVPRARTVPLIYPLHFSGGFVAWPSESRRKAGSIEQNERTEELLVPSVPYVLVKRFSSKEERRRIVAAVFDPSRLRAEMIGIENHVNYFHGDLPLTIAKGLATYLNSSLVDAYFRQFSGHTQVNATDLRSLRYPSRDQLEDLGRKIGSEFPTQSETDEHVEQIMKASPAKRKSGPLRAKRKIGEAQQALAALGVPRAQQNERSALTLLALLDLKPSGEWREAQQLLLGITPIMTFIAEHYGKQYAPNTRETIRRQSVHQFVQARVLNANPDDPERPVNSPKAVYQVAPAALVALRQFGSPAWPSAVGAFAREYARTNGIQERSAQVSFPRAQGQVKLSPGGQNLLIQRVLDEFLPQFVPGGKVLYVGDAQKKWLHAELSTLESLGLELDPHGKMPDLIVHDPRRDWLLLVEAVPSHGPVNPQRHADLQELFAPARPGLIFVTAFLDRVATKRFLGEIAWETEVWVSEEPNHLIHSNGERFLGP